MKITIENLTKVYKNNNKALSNVNLEIESGIFGLLGPNGAGKTTLMRILVTLMDHTDGTVKIDNMDIKKNRREIRSMLGYLPQEFNMFSKLTTWEFLDYAARLAGLRQGGERKNAVEEMLENVGLYEARDRQANKLSGGMKGMKCSCTLDSSVLVMAEAASLLGSAPPLSSAIYCMNTHHASSSFSPSSQPY